VLSVTFCEYFTFLIVPGFLLITDKNYTNMKIGFLNLYFKKYLYLVLLIIFI